jgi:hypothetical protein
VIGLGLVQVQLVLGGGQPACRSCLLLLQLHLLLLDCRHV